MSKNIPLRPGEPGDAGSTGKCKENFAAVLAKALDHLFLDRMEGNEEIYVRVINDAELKQSVLEALLAQIYGRIHPSDSSSQ